jgi:hypothetical protein
MNPTIFKISFRNYRSIFGFPFLSYIFFTEILVKNSTIAILCVLIVISYWVREGYT